MALDEVNLGRPRLDGLCGPMLGMFVQVCIEGNFSQKEAEHLIPVCMVLETLHHHHLYSEDSEFKFRRSSVVFLEHVISEDGVARIPRELYAIRNSGPGRILF